MKQKYLLSKDEENGLVIKEYAELEAGIFSLLCEEHFDEETVTKAVKDGSDALVGVLRTHNMYPPACFADPIAAAVADIYNEGTERRELLFDDIEFINQDQEVADSFDAEEESSDLIDDLLEEDGEDDDSFSDDELKDIDGGEGTNIQVAEDEGSDTDA